MSLLLELARQYPQLQFLWVGGSPSDVAHWSQQLAADNLQNVNLVGFIDNAQLPHYQAACDILLMPYEKVIAGSSGGNSASYASPMKMFEYMACQRAIISSDLPVIREVLNPSNAVLCPPEDAQAWSQALSALIGDENKRSALASQAWQDVQQYTWLARARRALQDFPPSQSGINHA
jgi:glycosyltransferase involved in cell wall biosynthesis